MTSSLRLTLLFQQILPKKYRHRLVNNLLSLKTIYTIYDTFLSMSIFWNVDICSGVSSWTCLKKELRKFAAYIYLSWKSGLDEDSVHWPWCSTLRKCHTCKDKSQSYDSLHYDTDFVRFTSEWETWLLSFLSEKLKILGMCWKLRSAQLSRNGNKNIPAFSLLHEICNKWRSVQITFIHSLCG